MEQSIKFKDNAAIMATIDQAIDAGINTFMCTTHDRIAYVCDQVRENPEKYKDFKIYPCMPYAHKYANAVTELGIQGTIKQYVPGNFFGSLFKGGAALVSKDYLSIMGTVDRCGDENVQRYKNTCYFFTERHYRSSFGAGHDRNIKRISRLYS